MSRCGSSSGGFKMTGMPELTTLCYLVKDGKALMLHRVVKKNDVNKDKWIGVGGHFEDGESPEDCAKREIYEETGLTAEAMTLNGIVTFDSAKQDHTEYMFLYTVTEWTGTAHECDEGVLEWIDFDRIRNMNLWEGDRIFLKLLDEGHPFFSLKLVYDEKDVLRGAVLDGRQMELFDILNSDGTLAGYTRERSIAHEMGSLHGTVHIWIARDTKKENKGDKEDNEVKEAAGTGWQLLLQKRAADKDSYPGCMDISSAGHIKAGDGVEETLLREFREEMGISASAEDFTYVGDHLSYHESVFYGKPFRDHELSHIFVYRLSDRIDAEKLRLQKEEIESVSWIDFDELEQRMKDGTIQTCIDPDELSILKEFLEKGTLHPLSQD
jgi:8-oxo-dGTP diphosphatase